MKKILSLIALTVVVSTGCSSAQQSSALKKAGNTVTFTYTAVTRGSNNKIVVKEGSIETTQSRLGEKPVVETLSDADWKAVKEAYSKVTVKNEELETIVPPSVKHQYDGAMIANLKISTSGKEFHTSSFDHGNPPAEVKYLVNKIIALSDMDKR
jgi:hypothetical protein